MYIYIYVYVCTSYMRTSLSNLHGDMARLSMYIEGCARTHTCTCIHTYIYAYIQIRALRTSLSNLHGDMARLSMYIEGCAEGTQTCNVLTEPSHWVQENECKNTGKCIKIYAHVYSFVLRMYVCAWVLIYVCMCVLVRD